MTGPRKQRPISCRHPLLVGRERGVWHADLVGKVPGYAGTEEGYKRRQEAARTQTKNINADGKRGSRKGIPDGWAGCREEVAKLRQEANEAGTHAVAGMLQKGLLDMPRSTDDERAVLALTACAQMVLDPTLPPRRKQSAARILLSFTKPAPAVQCDVQVVTAEDLLAELGKSG
jgi:hypothetical protein